MDAAALPEFAGQIELAGRLYDVPLPTDGQYSELSRWLEDRALARIERLRGAVAEQIYQERYEGVLRLVCAGVLSHGQPEFDRAIQSLEVREQLLWIVLHDKYPEITRDQVRGLFAQIVKQIQLANLKHMKQQQERQEQQQASA